MALGSTHPLTEMSIRCVSCRCVRLTTLPPSWAFVMKSGNLNFLEPSGPLQACNGTALPLPFTKLSAYQGRIKLFGEKISAPYFKQCFFRGGITPPDWDKHHAYQSQDRNNKYFILYIEFVATDLLFRLARMRHAWKGDCYLTVLVFHGRYYFYSLKFTLMFINERKRNGNIYLISNFDSLEAAPSILQP